MNHTDMIVRTTKDAEIRYSQSGGKTIANISVASDREFKSDNGPNADFYNCTAFGKTAELIEKYASRKGTQIGLEGRFQNNDYTDKDGVKHYGMVFMIAKITFIGSKNENSNSRQSAPADGGFMNIPDGIDSSLPFN